MQAARNKYAPADAARRPHSDPHKIVSVRRLLRRIHLHRLATRPAASQGQANPNQPQGPKGHQAETGKNRNHNSLGRHLGSHGASPRLQAARARPPQPQIPAGPIPRLKIFLVANIAYCDHPGNNTASFHHFATRKPFPTDTIPRERYYIFVLTTPTDRPN